MKKQRPTKRIEDIDIDLSPMIDCIFILLIFFIVTSVFVEDPGIEVERPNVSGSESVNRNAILVAITADNRVYFDGREIRIEQVAQQIKTATFDPDTPLIIRADKLCSHGVFAAVYSEAKKAGVGHVQFATQKVESL